MSIVVSADCMCPLLHVQQDERKKQSGCGNILPQYRVEAGFKVFVNFPESENDLMEGERHVHGWCITAACSRVCLIIHQRAHIRSYLILSYHHVMPCHSMSYHIISYHITYSGLDRKKPLAALKIHEILRRVSDDDCRALGFDPEFARPDWFVITGRCTHACTDDGWMVAMSMYAGSCGCVLYVCCLHACLCVSYPCFVM